MVEVGAGERLVGLGAKGRGHPTPFLGWDISADSEAETV